VRTTYLIQHSAPQIGLEEEEAVLGVLRSGRLAQGPEVAGFEAECAARVGRRYGVAVSSGTAALHLTLHALDAAPGHLVAIPAYACASLMTATALNGNVACVCDIGNDFNLDPGGVPPKARFVIAPHLFGKTAPILPRGTVIEDIAQSIGGISGRAGVAAVASFYATKLITTGEGGMVLTDDGDLAARLRDLRDYDNRDVFVPRYSYKMTEMQAAMGRVQLRRLPEFIERRRAIAERYLEAFAELPLGLPDPADHVFFRFVVTTGARAALLRRLNAEGVEAKRPVYCPAHRYVREGVAPGIARLAGDCRRAERAHAMAVSLPIHPGMNGEEVETVVDSVRGYFV
jgi:dTDP-4-amino-4,6-dideoxygalactose transaminase